MRDSCLGIRIRYDLFWNCNILVCIGNSGADIYIFSPIFFVIGLGEFYLEKKWWKNLSPKIKESKEIHDLKKQVEKERLKKELAELKQQNSH